MKILHLMSCGDLGGIEILCKNIADCSIHENEFAFLFSGGPIADQLEKTSRIYRLYENTNRLRRFRKLQNLVKKENYDVIIAHHGSLSIFIYFILLMHSIPHAVSLKYLHSSFDRNYYYKNRLIHDCLMNWSLKYIFRKSDHIIAVSEFVKDSFLKYFPCEKEQMHVIYNGITLSEHKIKKRNKEKIQILYIGRLVEIKGIDVLIQAARILKTKTKKIFEIEIVGSGPLKNDLKKLVNESGLDETVLFRKETLQKEVYFQNADLFVYPSVCDEAFGISLVEAMEYGIICVASDRGGIPEIVRHGENGFLFPSGDPVQLAKQLLHIINLNDESYRSLQNHAYQTAKKFSIEKTMNQLEQLYENPGLLEKTAADTAGNGKRSKKNM